MPDPTSIPPVQGTRPRRCELRPTGRRAWLGLWLLQWHSQWTWRRLPRLLVTLLTIPLLAFFTIEPLKMLINPGDWFEKPGRQVEMIKNNAVGSGVPLARGLGKKLQAIITEEQRRVDATMPATNTVGIQLKGEELLTRQLEQVRACRDRIQEQFRPLLDEKQFELFLNLEATQLEEITERIRNFNLHDFRPFYRWLVDFYFLLGLPLYCLSICGAMMRDELQTDTLVFLTTRPVSRARLFLRKYLCQLIWLEGVAAVQTLALFAAGVAREAPGAASVMGLFFATQILAVLAWSALSALLGLITRRYMLLGIVYGLLVEFGIGRIPTNINNVALTRHFEGLLGHDSLLHQLYLWVPQNVWFSVGMVLLATMLFLTAGALLFTFREYHSATEMQK